MKLRFLSLFIWAVMLTAMVAAEKPVDQWRAIRFLIGTWEGTGDGLSGHSTVTQTYEFILSGNFIQARTRAIFEPQGKNPEGEVHEDMEIFSHDETLGKIVIRGFYVEGFVNTYVLDEISEDGKILTFNTVRVENAPEGTRAQLIFERTSDAEMKQNFNVAFPGHELSCFSTNILAKK